MGFKKISSIKLYVQVKAFKNYKAGLYFLIDFLGVSTNQSRKDQIRSIKMKIKSIHLVDNVIYHHSTAIVDKNTPRYTLNWCVSKKRYLNRLTI
ncbi:hypothetical protein ATN88_12520 [Enterovibrio coralii]|uniref:Uncharacterized protein n=1 Tax=Enterovibrio coralii TaxID=294935 RepID=A0A135I2R0_9GAMM|nr:hypothetical protein ATN88_12520 [Enterovibrio coralii]